jgi:hypothetical protein
MIEAGAGSSDEALWGRVQGDDPDAFWNYPGPTDCSRGVGAGRRSGGELQRTKYHESGLFGSRRAPKVSKVDAAAPHRPRSSRPANRTCAVGSGQTLTSNGMST